MSDISTADLMKCLSQKYDMPIQLAYRRSREFYEWRASVDNHHAEGETPENALKLLERYVDAEKS